MGGNGQAWLRQPVKHADTLAPDQWSQGALLLPVEDKPVNQEVVSAMIEEHGIEIGIVENGRKALEALTRRPYDLVLMACHMAEMNDYGCRYTTPCSCRWLISVSERPTISLRIACVSPPSGGAPRCTAPGVSERRGTTAGCFRGPN